MEATVSETAGLREEFENMARYILIVARSDPVESDSAANAFRVS